MSHGVYHLEPDVNNLSQLAVVVMPATSNLVGGVKQGTGISIAADGTISATGGGQGAVSSVFGRTGAVVAASGDYTVAQVTGAAASATTITAGAGLTGGGDLSANRTLAVNIPAVQTPWLQNVNAAGFTLSNVPAVSGNGNITLAAGGAGTLTLQTNAKTRLSIDSGGTVTLNSRDSDGQAVFNLGANAAVWSDSAGNTALSGVGGLSLDTNNINRVYVTQAGNVGIGTTAPGALLSVNGSVQLQGKTECDDYLGMNLYNNGSQWIYRTNSPGLLLGFNSIVGAPSGTSGAAASISTILQFSYSGASPAFLVNSVSAFALWAGQGGTSEVLMSNYYLTFYWVSNTQLGLAMKGSDGVIRRAVLTVA